MKAKIRRYKRASCFNVTMTSCVCHLIRKAGAIKHGQILGGYAKDRSTVRLQICHIHVIRSCPFLLQISNLRAATSTTTLTSTVQCTVTKIILTCKSPRRAGRRGKYGHIKDH